MQDNIRHLLSVSFVGPFNSIDEIWVEKLLSVNNGAVAGLVFVAFAVDKIFVYNDVVHMMVGKHMEAKLELFLVSAQKYCNARINNQHKWPIGIMWNNKESLQKAKQMISKKLG